MQMRIQLVWFWLDRTDLNSWVMISIKGEMCQWINVSWCSSSKWRVCTPGLNTNTKAGPVLSSPLMNKILSHLKAPLLEGWMPFRCYILGKDTLLSSSNFLCKVPLPRHLLMWEVAEASRKERRREEWPVRQAGLGGSEGPELHWLQ